MLSFSLLPLLPFAFFLFHPLFPSQLYFLLFFFTFPGVGCSLCAFFPSLSSFFFHCFSLTSSLLSFLPILLLWCWMLAFVFCFFHSFHLPLLYIHSGSLLPPCNLSFLSFVLNILISDFHPRIQFFLNYLFLPSLLFFLHFCNLSLPSSAIYTLASVFLIYFPLLSVLISHCFLPPIFCISVLPSLVAVCMTNLHFVKCFYFTSLLLLFKQYSSPKKQ